MPIGGCVIMAGGRGSRMGFVEKPLLSVCGRTMLERVLEALEPVCRQVVVVYSAATPGAGRLCRSLALVRGFIYCVEGVGVYVQDLNSGLDISGLPALVAPSDMPLLTPEAVEGFLGLAFEAGPDIVGLDAKGRGPTGMSLFRRRSGSWTSIEADWCWALDVDTWEDLRRAESLCRGGCMAGGPL